MTETIICALITGGADADGRAHRQRQTASDGRDLLDALDRRMIV